MTSTTTASLPSVLPPLEPSWALAMPRFQCNFSNLMLEVCVLLYFIVIVICVANCNCFLLSLSRAHLLSFLQRSVGLPDVHSGYGFAIGNMAAFDMDDPEAIVSPGGVGFDINCGVRYTKRNTRATPPECYETRGPWWGAPPPVALQVQSKSALRLPSAIYVDNRPLPIRMTPSSLCFNKQTQAFED